MYRNNQTQIIVPRIEDYRKKEAHLDRIEFGLRVKGEFKKKSSREEPLVTIVTIVRNGERTIEKTIKSVLGQTYQNIEYVLIDGGSKDNTLNILRKYQDRIAYCLSEPDEGIGDAFNKGISFSTGELVGLINADDWYSQNAFQSVVERWRVEGNCIFHGKLQYWHSLLLPDCVFSGRDDLLYRRMSINHPTVFIPKKFYDELGLFRLDLKIAMDYDWMRRAKISGKRFCFIEQIISNMSLQGVSDRKWISAYREIFKIRRDQGDPLVPVFFSVMTMVFVTLVRKGLEKIRMNGFVRFFKRNFSAVKKEY